MMNSKNYTVSYKFFQEQQQNSSRFPVFPGVKKSEHLYSGLHGIQATLKCSGMDHTAFNLQRTPYQPLPRKRSPDGASTECGGGHLIAAHYSFIDPKRMKG